MKPVYCNYHHHCDGQSPLTYTPDGTVRKLRDLFPGEMVRIYVTTFEDEEFDLVGTARDLLSEAAWHKFLSSANIGYKLIRSFTIVTIDDEVITFSRNYRNQVFRREVYRDNTE